MIISADKLKVGDIFLGECIVCISELTRERYIPMLGHCGITYAYKLILDNGREIEIGEDAKLEIGRKEDL